MKELLINQFAPIFAMIITSLLLIIIKDLGKKSMEVLQKRKEEIEQKLIIGNHQQQLTEAKEIWYIVEEKFRISEKIEGFFISKVDLFEDMLQERFPSLTKEEIEYFRQAISGEFNKDKGKLDEKL